jgi:aspartyl-tRNA(Asn)/glutamyl-tRNA(Gln) amidotransferase subunit C
MSEPIDEAKVRHIAKLSRLELNDRQIATFVPQLARILEYVEKLSAVDTEGVEPMTHPYPIANVLREDTPRQSLPHDAAMANAPATIDGFFRVPRVIDHGGGA